MKNLLYILDAYTDIQVGDGGAVEGIIDKKVQKENGLPIIHGSSIKGALREHMEILELPENELKSLFGSGPKDVTAYEGQVKYYSARLWTYPVRGSNGYVYSGISENILKHIVGAVSDFGIYLEDEVKENLNDFYNVVAKLEENKQLEEHSLVISKDAPLLIEGYPSKSWDNQGIAFKELLKLSSFVRGDANFDLVVLSNEHMHNILKDLPNFARNKLVNGVSSNLWYEEYIPERAQFYVPMSLISKDVENAKNIFNIIEEKNVYLQIGSNASIGKGYFKMKFLGGN